jgi:hypothetical protein
MWRVVGSEGWEKPLWILYFESKNNNNCMNLVHSLEYMLNYISDSFWPVCQHKKLKVSPLNFQRFSSNCDFSNDIFDFLAIEFWSSKSFKNYLFASLFSEFSHNFRKLLMTWCKQRHFIWKQVSFFILVLYWFHFVVVVSWKL